MGWNTPVFQTRPISSWPGARTRHPKRSPFKAGWGPTLDLLERELRYLNARDVVIEVDVGERDIRNDGQLRADARPPSPGVILSFHSRKLGEPLRYPCDAFGNWQDNVRAIALALEALRKVDRYGVTRHAEQYRGWRALPGQASTTLTAEGAAEVIVRHAGADAYEAESLVEDPDLARLALRDAQRATHPDAGGTVAAFQEVQAAWTVLSAHHGRAATHG